MAALTDVRTFWGTLLSVLLKCIAALGFTAPAARAARRSRTAGAALPVAAEHTALVAATGPGTAPDGAGTGRIPAPRGYEAVAVRGRTLPPTMKQRIGAEAHGSSPSARTLRTSDVLADDFTGTMTIAAAATGATGAPGTPGTSGTADPDRAPLLALADTGARARV
jgi:hypothetical protein